MPGSENIRLERAELDADAPLGVGPGRPSAAAADRTTRRATSVASTGSPGHRGTSSVVRLGFTLIPTAAGPWAHVIGGKNARVGKGTEASPAGSRVPDARR
ncbi:hypothetical protein GCM10009787_28540 [Streptomyces bangladeshensis]|uniref:Uncharacterized protein n=1 Tax=Streptomyces bangladeshensis TaxID=295352 RepID=A0ABN3BHG0_9ACTN